MKDPKTQADAMKVALPAHLPARLQAFRIGKGEGETYVVRDRLLNKSYDFEPWQFFVLEVLPACQELGQLSSAFSDRFGYEFPQKDVEELFGSLADAELFNEAAAKHPLLKRYCTKTYSEENGQPKLKSFRGGNKAHLRDASEPPKKPTAPPGVEVVEEKEVLPAGVQDATDFDPRRERKLWLSIQPQWALKLLLAVARPLKPALYLLPLLFGAALIGVFRYAPVMKADFEPLLSHLNFFQHALFSLFTVNLLITWATALVAYHYRATVRGIGVALIFGFFPRFALNIRHVKQLTRSDLLWLHGTPILLRLTVLSLSLFVWRATRDSLPTLSQAALALMLVAGIGLFISTNPLIKSSGYHLLATFANEPHLRGKSYKALLNRLNQGKFRDASDPLLSAYALATVLFMFVLIALVVLVLGTALHRIQLGGSAFLIMGLVGAVLLSRTVRHVRNMQQAYERSQQFERWRRRALPQEPTPENQTTASKWASYWWKALPLCFFAVLFVPYSYTPGGDFKITPALQQVIATDVSGVITQVHVQGGEPLKKGHIIAELDTAENQAEVDILNAQIKEQEAHIADLKSRPREADVAVAREALRVSQSHAKYAKSQLERLEAVYAKNAISFAEVDKARGDYEVSLRRVEESKAKLAMVSEGVSPEQVAAAEAKLESITAKRDSYADRIRRSKLVMPFDGRLLTLGLQDKGNAYYTRGDSFAAAEVEGRVRAEIEVPESDVEYLALGNTVHVRPKSFSSRLFDGKVETIDWNVSEKPFGNVIKVIATIEDPKGQLRNGMTGYAKIDGPTLPVWKAFSLAVTRFFSVEVWSWIP